MEQYYPKVGCITPTTHGRQLFNQRISEIFFSQDYANKVHFLDYSSETIGQKRNNLCHAEVDIIVHFDSDDLYAPDWISKSVAALQQSRSDIVGLSNAYFYNTHQRQTYELIPKPNTQLYLCGATLCYWRHVWERKAFPDTSAGEDTQFISNNGRLHCHAYKEGFIATVHGGNTECHKALPLLTKVNVTLPLLQVLNGQQRPQ